MKFDLTTDCNKKMEEQFTETIIDISGMNISKLYNNSLIKLNQRQDNLKLITN